MTLTAITSSIRAVKGEIVSLGPTAHGFVVWATVGGRSCRIIAPSANKPSKAIPPVAGCQTHVVSDDPSFQAWLNSISNPSN